MSRYSLVSAFANLTGYSDGDIALLTGLGRSTIQAYRVGRLEEKLNDAQKQKLLEVAQAYRLQVYEAVAEMELLT